MTYSGWLRCRAEQKTKDGRRSYVITVTNLGTNILTFVISEDTSVQLGDPAYIAVEILQLGPDWAWVCLPVPINSGQVVPGQIVPRCYLKGEENCPRPVPRLEEYFPTEETPERKGRGRPSKSPPPENSPERAILLSDVSNRKKGEALGVDHKTIAKWIGEVT